MTTRSIARCAVAALGLLVALGCSATDDTAEQPPDTTAAPPGTAITSFCVRFPLRDAGTLFSVPADPALAGDPAVGDQLLEIAASGLAESAPASIRAAVDTYVEALRAHEAGSDPPADPLSDPAVRSAVDEINGWLRDNCPAPPATSPPPATAP